MNKLIIKSLLIVDIKQEEANKFKFFESSNLIVSERNGEGKSSLVKSIYYCLGANLKAFPKGWDYKKYIFQLEVSINKTTVWIKRYNNIITVLDNGEVKNFGNLKDYSSWFQNKMGMKLKLVSKNKVESSLASMEAILSPLYIDQDKSWDGKLFKNSFEGLGQYTFQSFPKDVFDYYLDISDEKMIDKQDQKNRYQEHLKEKKIKIEQVQSVYEEYRQKTNASKMIPQEFEIFEKQLNYYIQETEKFSVNITKETDKLSKEKMKLDILKQDKTELEKLLKKTEERLSDIHYECVYCHSVLTRQQSLTRMELDDNKIEILLQTDLINQKISKSEEEVRKRELDIKNLENQFELYHEILSDLNQLSDINDYVNQKVLLELESLKIQESNELGKLVVKIEDLKKEISALKKQYNDKEKKIKQKFEMLKNEITLQLKAEGISNKKALNYNTLHGSGTNLNKDLLTIYLIYMNLIDNNKNFGLPFAIDSFVKNETDSNALEKMFNVVDKYFLTLNSQTFFSIINENIRYINNSTNIIKVEKPLLKKDFYNCIVRELI